MQTSYERALHTAIEAAQEAGEMLRAEFLRDGGPRGHGEHAEDRRTCRTCYPPPSHHHIPNLRSPRSRTVPAGHSGRTQVAPTDHAPPAPETAYMP